jgi:hypothetical protein
MDFTNIITELKSQNFYTKRFYYTKIKLKKVDQRVFIDHSWRYSGLLLLAFLFVTLLFSGIFIIRILVEYSKVISDFDTSVEILFYSIIAITILFGFSFISKLDNSLEFLNDIESNSRLFVENDLFITRD